MRSHWANMRDVWLRVRMFIGGGLGGVTALWIFLFFPLHVQRLAWPWIALTLAAAGYLAISARLWWFSTTQDRALEKVRSIPVSADDPEIVAAIEGLMPQFRHPGSLLVLSQPALSYYAKRAEWQECIDVMAMLPRQYRRLLAACITEPEPPRMPLAARLQIGRAWLRPFWPLQAFRSLMALHLGSMLLFRKQHYASSFKVCRAIWRVRREPFIAVNCACCLAQLGNLDEGVSWLLRALDRGYPPSQVMTDSDLSPLLSDPRVSKLLPLAADPLPRVDTGPSRGST